MKLVALAFAIALGSLALVPACSVSHRSDAYACSGTGPSSCSGGRVCVDGFCVVPGTIDGPGGHPDGPRGIDGGNNCPGQCTSCSVTQKTCVIDCQQGGCNNSVSCPQGYKCDIRCDVEGSCTHGVSCQNAAGCQVECSGRNSCQGVSCGAGPCDVSCSGPSSCQDVACNQSCACDVVCTGNQSCTGNIQCTFGCDSGAGCTSLPPLCNSPCP